MSTQAIILVFGCVVLLAAAISLVRRGRLSIRYGMGWLFLAALGVVGAPVLSMLSGRVADLGFTATGFSLGVLLIFLGLVCLQLSVTVSGLTRAVQEMSERDALLGRTIAALDGTDARPEAVVMVLVPAFNEQGSVADVVRSVLGLGFRVCVIDDGSRDHTARAARDAGAEVLQLPFNLGVGGALRAGFRYAIEQGCSIVVQVDADGQHEVEDIPALVDALAGGEADMAVGSRFLDADSTYEVGRWRKVAMRVLAWRVSRATGTRLTDATSGFRAIGPALLERFSYEYPVEYLGDTVEALVIAGERGARVVERPVRMYVRTAGAPSAGVVASAWYTLRVLLAVELMRGRRAGPPPPPVSRGEVR